MSHIALLLPDLEVGGAQRVMLLLAREFLKRGHRVDLVVLNSSGPLYENIPEGVKVTFLAPGRFRFGQMGLSIFSVFRLAAWIRRNTPDVLLCTITGTNLVALLARKVSAISVRLVIREANTLDNVSGSLRLRAMRWLYPQADEIIALSSIMKTELNQEIGVPVSNIHCIANPVDTVYINEQGRIPIEHRWLDGNKHKIVISVGRLVSQKDFTTLLRAFALLPLNLSARLIILGEGVERGMLEQLAVDLGIADVTQFVGFDANPWRWMARSQLFVLSSRWEGYPNVLLEALALGIPAISTEYDASVHDLATRYGFGVVPAGKETILAREIEVQLSSDLKQKYRLANEVEGLVAKYLNVLGCEVSSSDHETTSIAP